MTIFLKEGDSYFPAEDAVVQKYDVLPVGTYTVNQSLRGFYFSKIEDFELPGKLYGNTHRHADKILNTFKSRPNATGTLLNGEKGSGKTMLAKLISIRGREQGIPTVVINSPYCGEDFNQFMQSVNQPLIIIFDEFEKVFNEEQQAASLTLFDGVYPSKKLFLLTVNDKYSVNKHMRNRPGRIFYLIDYTGLDADFVREYCQENLNDQTHTESMCRLVMFFDAFNFDMLKAMVEEMNRYNESPHQVLEMLNAKPLTESSALHNIQVFHDGKEITDEYIYPTQVRGNPLQVGELELQVNLHGVHVHEAEYDEDTSKANVQLTLTPDLCQGIDSVEGTFTYVAKNGITVVFKRQTQKVYDYSRAF